MIEATNIYNSIIGDATKSRTDKAKALNDKVLELKKSAIQYMQKALSQYDIDTNLMLYSSKMNQISKDLLKISQDGEYLSINF